MFSNVLSYILNGMAKHEDSRLQRALSPIKSRFYCRSCLGEEAKMMSLLDEPIRTAFRDCTSILVRGKRGGRVYLLY